MSEGSDNACANEVVDDMDEVDQLQELLKAIFAKIPLALQPKETDIICGGAQLVEGKVGKRGMGGAHPIPSTA